MARRVRLDIDRRAVAALTRDTAARRMAETAGEQVAAVAARDAPKRTGGLARSMHAETSRDADGQWQAEVSYDREHYYGGFHALGTKSTPVDPYLRRAPARTRI